MVGKEVKINSIHIAGILILCTILLALIIVAGSQPDQISQEKVVRQQLLKSPVSLSGTILDEMGTPVKGAKVSLQNQISITTGNGSFLLNNLSRENSLLTIDAPGFRREIISVHLFLPGTEDHIPIDPVLLTEDRKGVVRFLFGGDTHFGRRYLGPQDEYSRDQLPQDNEDALISVTDPQPGTMEVLRFIRPFFQEADFGSVNLESPVTLNVSTPHQTKDYILMTLPGSLPALAWLGVSYVSLGNNHIYDYLDSGIKDTLKSLDNAGIAYSGAGENVTEAFRSYHTTIKGSHYAFLAMTSIDGIQHPVSYVADDKKGGAANLKDRDAVISSIKREINAGYIPIVQVHGGDEYTYEPPDFINSLMDLVVQAGAGLIISHHPHMAQGVGIRNGIVVLEGVGNMAFDAERFESTNGILAQVDMEGSKVRRVRLIPISIGNFTPHPLSGDLANLILRRIGEFSRNSPYPVYPYNGQGWVALQENQAITTERTVLQEVNIPESRSTIIDLRRLARSDESLAAITDSLNDTSVRLGRDLMLYGDFEDHDVDDSVGESDMWDTSGNSAVLSLTGAYRGTQSLLSMRNFRDQEDSIIPFRNRIRVIGDARNQTPNKNLTFLGYIKGNDAGPVSIYVRYLPSEDPIHGEKMKFDQESLVEISGGTFPWKQVVEDLHMPPDNPDLPRDPTKDPRALQLFIQHTPSISLTSTVQFDDFAIISWEETVNITGTTTFRTPHARDFIRITGSPGTHEINMTFRSYQPLNTGNQTS